MGIKEQAKWTLARWWFYVIVFLFWIFGSDRSGRMLFGYFVVLGIIVSIAGAYFKN